ncbi:hypothetical protein EXS54_00330 [Patescibacteria group bacterium]|nr:hypothetical protein [Patescibacteria group bacterium]
MNIRTIVLRTAATVATIGLVLSASGCLNDPPKQSGVFATKDAGSSWNSVPDLTATGIKKPKTYPPLEVNAVGVSHTDANTVVAGTNNDIYFTTNAGGEWKKLTEELPTSTKAMTVQAALFHPTEGNTFYLGGVSGGYGKVIKSDDGGKSLHDVFTVSKPGQSVTSLTISPDGSTLYAGDQLGSVYRSRDGGTTWERIFALEKTPITALVLSGSNVFAATAGQGVWRSADGGAFAPANGNLQQNNQTAWSLAAGFGGLYLGTDKGLFLTRDFGANWQSVGNALPASGSPVQAIAVAGSNLYFATNAVIYRANPDGGNFVPTQLKLAKTVYSLGVSSSNETLYAGANASGTNYSSRYEQGLSGFNIGPK